MALIAKEIIFLLKIKLELDSQSLGQRPFKSDDSIDYNALGRTIKKKCESFLLAKSNYTGVLFQRDLKSTAKKNWKNIFPEKRGEIIIRSMPDCILKKEIHYHITSDPDSLKRIFTGKSKIHNPKTHHTVAWCFDYECWEDFIEHTPEATLKKLRNKFSNIGGYSVLVDEIVRLLDDAKTGSKEESPKDSSIHQPQVNIDANISTSDEGKNELNRKSEISTESTFRTEEDSDIIQINSNSLTLDDAIRIPIEKMQFEQEQREMGNRTFNETLSVYQKIDEIINFMTESQHKIIENLSPSEEEILVENDFNQIIEEQNGKHLHHVVSKYLGSKGRAKWQWYHRSAIISAVSISFIKRFDEEKANFLIRCINERDSEQEKDGIWQKALIGLLLGLVMVSKNSRKVEMVLRQIKNLSESQELKQAIKIIMGFILNSEKPRLKINFNNPFKEDNFFKKTFHWFIPFHENTYLLKNVLEKHEKNVDITLFSSLLSNSISLSTTEKISVAYAFPRLVETQVNELISIFNEEVEKFGELEKKGFWNVKHVIFFKLFYESLSNLKQLDLLNSCYYKIVENSNSLNIEFVEAVSANIQSNLTIRYYIDNEERAKRTLEYYKKLTLEKRDQKYYWENTAEAHVLLKDYNQSIQESEEYLKFGKDALALRRIGWCTMKIAKIEKSSEKFEIAIQKFEESLEIEEDVWALQQIGWCTIKIAEIEKSPKKYEIAIQKFEESLEIEEDAWTLRQIGWCYLLLNNPIESKKWYTRAIETQKEECSFMNLGHCELVLINKKEALEYYKTSLDLWNCSQEFFIGFEDDFQYIEPQGVSKEEYQKMKSELQKYCKVKESLKT